MEKFYPYWRFFCSMTFAKNDKLHFYENGTFAVVSDGIVALYSNEAKHICCYHNAFILPNGCICERKNEHIHVHYKKDKQYSIPCLSDTKLRARKNTVEAEETRGSRILHFITPDFGDYRSLVLSENRLTVEGVSADNKLLLRDPSHKKELQEKNGNVLLMGEGINRVDFLKNGSYIVHTSGQQDGSFFYNRNNELVLQSEQDYGILPLGDCVRYENALIADANGFFIGEYNQETAVYGDIHVFAYKVMRSGDTLPHFWPGGKMMCFYNQYLGWVLCYWHGGHFYFAPQDVRKKPEAFYPYLLSQSNSYTRYLLRIKEILWL